nr:hypothetical protein [Megasphaera lornae]
MEISQSASRLIKEFLRKELQLEERDMYMIPGPLDCQVFFPF